eukprot:TRINITY_DN6766_c1_g1_i1.p1 TRINITY_DN6766_c1_g1~~TRINITY_DN6766_c1_g1_i1.p1  ORF type:complete len:385 (-),score=111.31 TRINITY_DN6766_c1_g1_i1:553-1707(-)
MTNMTVEQVNNTTKNNFNNNNNNSNNNNNNKKNNKKKTKKKNYNSYNKHIQNKSKFANKNKPNYRKNNNNRNNHKNSNYKKQQYLNQKTFKQNVDSGEVGQFKDGIFLMPGEESKQVPNLRPHKNKNNNGKNQQIREWSNDGYFVESKNNFDNNGKSSKKNNSGNRKNPNKKKKNNSFKNCKTAPSSPVNVTNIHSASSPANLNQNKKRSSSPTYEKTFEDFALLDLIKNPNHNQSLSPPRNIFYTSQSLPNSPQNPNVTQPEIISPVLPHLLSPPGNNHFANAFNPPPFDMYIKSSHDIEETISKKTYPSSNPSSNRKTRSPNRKNQKGTFPSFPYKNSNQKRERSISEPIQLNSQQQPQQPYWAGGSYDNSPDPSTLPIPNF